MHVLTNYVHPDIGDDVSVNFDEEKTIDTVLQNTTSEIEMGKSAAISQGI